MDVNILIICITVVVALFIVGATASACVEKVADLRRPRSLAEVIGGLLPPKDGDGDE